MLRIEIHDASNTALLRIEGRFLGALAEDTKTMLIRCRLPMRLVVNLSDLTFVDWQGEQVLLWLARVGARFAAETSYSRFLCEQLALPLVEPRRQRRAAVVSGA